MKKKISVVIPTYNEEANVVPLAKAIVEVMERDLSNYDYEILFIDNHSRDNTQALLRGSVERTKGSRRFLTQGTSGRPVRRFME